jgi:hypothetical protein
MITFILAVTVVPKQGVTLAGVTPALPSLDELCTQLAPLLSRGTERHQLLGFTVTEVTQS